MWISGETEILWGLLNMKAGQGSRMIKVNRHWTGINRLARTHTHTAHIMHMIQSKWVALSWECRAPHIVNFQTQHWLIGVFDKAERLMKRQSDYWCMRYRTDVNSNILIIILPADCLFSSRYFSKASVCVHQAHMSPLAYCCVALSTQ